MKKYIYAILTLITLTFLLSGCLPLYLASSLSSSSPSDDYSAFRKGASSITGSDDSSVDEAEALQWLKSTKNKNAFATSRFDDTQEAIDFVQQLYDAGALKVYVTNFSTNKNSEEYADALTVTLPENSAKRNKILSYYKMEVQIYGCNQGNENSGLKGNTLTLWWGKG